MPPARRLPRGHQGGLFEEFEGVRDELQCLQARTFVSQSCFLQDDRQSL